MILWPKSHSMHYYDWRHVIIIDKDNTDPWKGNQGLQSSWADLQVFTDWIETKLRFSKILNVIGCNGTKCIPWNLQTIIHEKVKFFWIMVKVQKDIKCLIGNKEGTTHTIRPRSGRIVYKNYCLGTWQIFFWNHFEKSVSFGARVCPPLGAGGNFWWEARRLSSFSDVFQGCDPHSLFGFSIGFHFKMW